MAVTLVPLSDVGWALTRVSVVMSIQSKRAEEIREELRIMSNEENRHYTHSRELSKRMEYNAKQIGRILVDLEDVGDVEEWGGSGRTTWKICL